ncbi:adenylylsulfatase HINT3 [Malania oleifera]|uniref:adenylylsulfatase HINT3 n=1 Tax=Malania oleifera TaxID=397392 RepID=UPI0025AE8E76|nr:adenylylsulfatase HINT3 [Malania oleifera]
MEAQRRVAILCAHLRPTSHCPFVLVSTFNCVAGANNRGRLLFGSEKQSRVSDCVFCDIVQGESPALKLYEDDTCICILDTNPLSHGHSLIIPKSHFSTLEATPAPVVAAMCSKIPFISNAIMKATGCDSFNLLVNNGAAAGQVIFHAHIHIIPRKASDCLWDSESLRRIPLKLGQEASQLVDRVQEMLTLSDHSEDGSGQGSGLHGS